jgi:hypothetical protein
MLRGFGRAELKALEGGESALDEIRDSLLSRGGDVLENHAYSISMLFDYPRTRCNHSALGKWEYEVEFRVR